MKNTLPLPALGFMSSFILPGVFLVNSLDSPFSGNFSRMLLISSVILPIFSCLLFAFFWWGLGVNYSWDAVDQKEHEAFLQREQQRAQGVWKFRGGIVVFVLLLSSIVATVAYGIHSFWKAPSISLELFLSASLSSYAFVAIALIFWLDLCDGRMRRTRPA